MHYLSICACVNFDREWELLQWYKYHLATGVEHFYLIDDSSSVDIRACFDPKHLTIAPRELFPDGREVSNQQTEDWQDIMIRDYMPLISSENKWIAYIDSDEYLFTKEKTFADYLSTMESYEGIELKHRRFLCGGHLEPKPKQHYLNYLNKYHKSYTTKCVVNHEVYKGIPANIKETLRWFHPCIHRITPNSVNASGDKPFRKTINDEPDNGNPRYAHHAKPEPKDHPAWTQHYPIRDKRQLMKKHWEFSNAHVCRGSGYLLTQLWYCFADPHNSASDFNFKKEHPYVYKKFIELYH